MKYAVIIFSLFLSWSSNAQSIVINEVLTQNKGLVKSSSGNTFDYIELYNSGTKALDLGGYYLSDDKDTIKMYTIPKGTTIKSKGFLIFWANGDKPSKELNTNFKLKQSGEKIYLSYPNGTICHKLRYKRQFKNISYGLLPDGGDDKDYLIPTPGAANKTGRIFVSDRKGKSKSDATIELNQNNYSVLIQNPNQKTITVKVLDNKTDKVLHRTKVETSNATIHFASYANGKYKLLVDKDTYRILKK